MKFIFVFLLCSSSAFGQFEVSKLKEMARPVMEACKEDKSKIKGCESYTEIAKLKTCLLANKEQLSEKCKMSLKLVK